MSSVLEIFKAANNECEKFATNLPPIVQSNPLVSQITDLKNRITNAEQVVNELKENDRESTQLKNEISSIEDDLKKLKQLKDSYLADKNIVEAEIKRLSELIRTNEANTQQIINEVANFNEAQLDAAIELVRQLEQQYLLKQNAQQQYANTLPFSITEDIVQIKQFITPSRPILNGAQDQVTVEEAELAYTAVNNLIDEELPSIPTQSAEDAETILRRLRNAIVNLQIQIRSLASTQNVSIFFNSPTLPTVIQLESATATVTNSSTTGIPNDLIRALQEDRQALAENNFKLQILTDRIKEIDKSFSELNKKLSQKTQDESLNNVNKSLQQQILTQLIDDYTQITDVNQTDTVLSQLNGVLNQKYQSLSDYIDGLPVEDLGFAQPQLIPAPQPNLFQPSQQISGLLNDVDGFLSGRSGAAGAISLFSDVPLLGPMLNTGGQGFSDALNFAKTVDSFTNGGHGTDQTPMPIDLKFATIDDARRDLMVIEYDLNPVDDRGRLRDLNQIKTTRMKFFINPDKIDVNYSKNRVETFTRGGYVYTHWGDKPTTIDLSGNMGTGGTLPVRALQHFFEVSGKTYEEIGKKYRDAGTNDGDAFFLDQLRNVTKYINSTAIESGFSKGWYGSFRTRLNQNSTVTFSNKFTKFSEEQNRGLSGAINNLTRTADNFGDSILGAARSAVGLGKTITSVAQIGIGLTGAAGATAINIGTAPGLLPIAGVKGARSLLKGIRSLPGIPATSTPTVPTDLIGQTFDLKAGIQAFADKNTGKMAEELFKCDVLGGYKQDINNQVTNKALAEKLAKRNADIAYDQALDSALAQQEVAGDFWRIAQLGFQGSQAQLAQAQLAREQRLYDQWERMKEQEIISLTTQADSLIADYRNDFYSLRGVFGNTRLRNVQKYGLRATVRIRLYHEDTLYIGHIDNFSYNRSAERFTVNWNMKFVVEETFVFPKPLDADSQGSQGDLAKKTIELAQIPEEVGKMFSNGVNELGKLFGSSGDAAANKALDNASSATNLNLRYNNIPNASGDFTSNGVTIVPLLNETLDSGVNPLGFRDSYGAITRRGEVDTRTARDSGLIDPNGSAQTSFGVNF